MSKLLHLAAAGILAAFAAASLMGLASAAPDNQAKAASCDKVICMLALF